LEGSCEHGDELSGSINCWVSDYPCKSNSYLEKRDRFCKCVTKGEAAEFDVSCSHIVAIELFRCLYSHLSFILIVKYVIVFLVE
jgi:hypothetical protein